MRLKRYFERRSKSIWRRLGRDSLIPDVVRSRSVSALRKWDHLHETVSERPEARIIGRALFFKAILSKFC